MSESTLLNSIGNHSITVALEIMAHFCITKFTWSARNALCPSAWLPLLVVIQFTLSDSAFEFFDLEPVHLERPRSSAFSRRSKLSRHFERYTVSCNICEYVGEQYIYPDIKQLPAR